MRRASEIGSGELQSSISSRDKPVEVARLGLEACIPPSLPPSFLPQKEKEALVVCKSSWVIFLLYFRETQISEIQIQVFINNNLFISLVLMDNDTYNLYESLMLDYLLSGSTP